MSIISSKPSPARQPLLCLEVFLPFFRTAASHPLSRGGGTGGGGEAAHFEVGLLLNGRSESNGGYIIVLHRQYQSKQRGHWGGRRKLLYVFDLCFCAFFFWVVAVLFSFAGDDVSAVRVRFAGFLMVTISLEEACC